MGMCFVYCALKFPNFWSLLPGNPGAFLGLFASSLLLVPVAAVFAWVATKGWIVAEPHGRPAFISMLAASMILTVALFIGVDCLVKLKTANDTIITLDGRVNLLKDKLAQTQDYALALEDGQKIDSRIIQILAKSGTEARLDKSERLIDLLDRKIETTVALIENERKDRQLSDKPR